VVSDSPVVVEVGEVAEVDVVEDLAEEEEEEEEEAAAAVVAVVPFTLAAIRRLE
jgi:hypothetical protein